ncbi:hypothetical protein LTR99_011268, partial [Exophiala xenobiotica]
MVTPGTSSGVAEVSRSSRLSSEIEADYDPARGLDQEEQGGQLGKDNEIQAHVEQPTDRGEIAEGGVEMNREIDEEEQEVERETMAEEEEVEQEEVEQEEVEQEEVEQEE